MDEPSGRVVGIANKPERDGAHVLEIKLRSGEVILATIEADMARAIVHVLHPAIAEEAARLAQKMSLPQIDVVRFDAVHQGSDAQLTASTTQMGPVVLRASLEVLYGLQAQVERVLKMRSPSSSIN
jgi:hypothetical protein